MTVSRRLVATIAAAIAALALAGCAHSIDVSPNMARLTQPPVAKPGPPVKVGFYIAPALSSTEITTPGGGGDNVRYFPYRDIEDGYQRILSNVFSGAMKLTSVADPGEIERNGLEYIIVPDLITASGGSGHFTWQPTSFTVDLASNIRDRQGKTITSLRVVGIGTAETGERLSEHGFAGKRAMEDALIKMQASLQEFKQSPGKAEGRAAAAGQAPAHAVGQSSARLAEIKQLLDKGQITPAEYETKRKAILEAL